MPTNAHTRSALTRSLIVILSFHLIVVVVRSAPSPALSVAGSRSLELLDHPKLAFQAAHSSTPGDYTSWVLDTNGHSVPHAASLTPSIWAPESAPKTTGAPRFSALSYYPPGPGRQGTGFYLARPLSKTHKQAADTPKSLPNTEKPTVDPANPAAYINNQAAYINKQPSKTNNPAAYTPKPQAHTGKPTSNTINRATNSNNQAAIAKHPPSNVAGIEKQPWDTNKQLMYTNKQAVNDPIGGQSPPPANTYLQAVQTPPGQTQGPLMSLDDFPALPPPKPKSTDQVHATSPPLSSAPPRPHLTAPIGPTRPLPFNYWNSDWLDYAEVFKVLKEIGGGQPAHSYAKPFSFNYHL